MNNEVERPFVIYSTDSHFYIKSRKPTFAPSFIRINRLTSKLTVMNQQKFAQLMIKQSEKGEKALREQIYMVIGIIIINQQPYLSIVRQIQPVATLNIQRIYCIKKVQFIPFKHKFLYKAINQAENQKIIQELSQNIINNNFYFCYHMDITLTYQKYIYKKKTEKKYFWNQNMLMMFTHYDLPMCWRIPIVQGHVREIYSENNYFSFYYCVISRRSKYKSGTRFNSRGIDLKCNASNFVQTQQIFICHNYLFSHVSLRGSVPVFWSQTQYGAPIKFSNTDEDNMRVFQKHYEFLKKQYLGNIVTINLLSKNKSPQKQLKNVKYNMFQRFEFYFNRVFAKQPYIYYDLNEQIQESKDSTKKIDQFINPLKEILAPRQNYFCIDRYNNSLFSQQTIIARINCLDCIDRTNVIMSRISMLFMEQVTLFINQHTNMEEKRLRLPKQYYQTLRQIWAQIGDRISMIYCGTQSLATHLIKQQNSSFFSYITSGFKSINRYYNANVNDGFKQTCINFFLGQELQKSTTTYFDDNITKGVIKQQDYCTYKELVIYFLTWNCNTVDPTTITQKDKQRLFGFPIDKTDIVVICLQEMVQLNSYNVLLGNNKTIIQSWKNLIQEYINFISDNKFVYLTSYDMVGISTFVFVNTHLHTRIIHQQWKDTKTGFNNSLGNKGAITLFLQIDSSYISIINCHLAAGQNASQERQQDINYIHNNALNERKLRRLFDKSQFKFFIGDMNFRLQAKNQNVRQILYTIQKSDAQKKLTKNQMQIYLQSLLQKDQYYLNNMTGILSMYKEGTIYFLPTYKFIKKQKNYDIKRTPSWCDRILFYSQQHKKLVILKYWDIDCYLSDHKPVCGAFKILIKKQDSDKKKKLLQLYMQSAQ